MGGAIAHSAAGRGDGVNPGSPPPPRLAAWVIRTLVPAGIGAPLLIDLAERFQRLARTEGLAAARRWYWRQVRLSIRPAILGGLSSRPRPVARSEEASSSGSWLPGWRNDVRSALRGFRRSPGFTTAALLILLLGIGGSTSVFTLVNAVLLRPLPYDRPDQLAVMWSTNTRQGLPDGSSALNARDWLDRSQALVDLALFVRPEFTTATVQGLNEPARVHVGVVTWNLFDLLGVRPIVGRTFLEQDVGQNQRLVVISEAYWSARYGRDPGIVGRTIQVDGEEYRIIGVVSSDVRVPRPTTMIWILHDPFAPGPMSTSRRNDAYVVLGRLAPGTTVDDAQRELDAIAASLADDFPETNRDLGVSVRSLQAEVVGDRLPQVLWMLLGAVVLVLLVAASNVAHLSMARGAQRHREFAIRAALGANRLQMIRLQVIESVILAVVAGLGGIVVGNLALDGLLALVPGQLPRAEGIGLDGSVVLVAVAAVAVAGPVFGFIPAVLQTRLPPAEALRTGGRWTAGAVGRSKFRRGLVVAEVAMAVILLAQAGLFLRSVRAIQAIDPGFDPEAFLVAQVDVDFSGRDRETLPALYGEFVEAVEALPGVRGVGVMDDFFIRRFPDMRIRVEGAPPPAPDEPAPRLTSDLVYPGSFGALGLGVLEGRDLSMSDIPVPGTGGPRSYVINRAMAETFWPGESAVGKRFSWGDSENLMTVVGVVRNLRRGRLEEEPYPQAFGAGVTWGMDLLVRTDGNPLPLAESVRRAVREVDAGTPVSGVGTAWTHFGETMGERRIQTWLLGLFSGLATLIAAVGLYALLHDAVMNRRREIGIRVALGADPAAVRALVIREGLGLSTVGLVLGLAGAVAASAFTRAMLYGITSLDPVTLAGVSALLLGVAAAASWIPAGRATRVQPIETLGTE